VASLCLILISALFAQPTDFFSLVFFLNFDQDVETDITSLVAPVVVVVFSGLRMVVPTLMKSTVRALSLSTGQKLIDLKTIPKWGIAGS
jgi:hypothetical protein